MKSEFDFNIDKEKLDVKLNEKIEESSELENNNEIININKFTPQNNKIEPTVEFKMPDQKSINMVIFCTHFIAFVKQSVKGCIMSIYKFYSQDGTFKKMSRQKVKELIKNKNSVFDSFANYLNTSWKNYFQKTDEYILSKINFMMQFGNFTHYSCLFKFIWEFTQSILFYILARLDDNELKDAEFLSSCIDIISDAILSFHVENLLNIELKCGESCEVYNYKEGEDFIKMGGK